MFIWIKFAILICFSSLVPKMSLFTLAIFYLTIFNLSWFMDLTLYIFMQFCSLHHQTLLSSPDTSTAEHHFHFSPAPSFFLELLLIVLHITSWILLTWEAYLPISYLFAPLYCSWGSCDRNTDVVCHSLLQWTTFCQSSSLWPIHFGWPCMAWAS